MYNPTSSLIGLIILMVTQLIEPSSLKGKFMLFFVARALDIAYCYTIVRRLFGFVPKDDAPELPD